MHISMIYVCSMYITHTHIYILIIWPYGYVHNLNMKIISLYIIHPRYHCHRASFGAWISATPWAPRVQVNVTSVAKPTFTMGCRCSAWDGHWCHWEKDLKQKKHLFLRYWCWSWYICDIFFWLIRIAATGLGCSCDVPALKYETVAGPIVLVQSHSPSCLFQVVPNVLSTQSWYQNGWWRLLVLVRIAGSYGSCTAKWWTIKTGEMFDIYNT